MRSDHAPPQAVAAAPAIVARTAQRPVPPPTIAATPDAPPRQAAAAVPAAAPTPAPAPLQAPPAPPPLPASVSDVPAIDATAMPLVRLSMHMWDESPAKRFVIVDGRRLAEGDRSDGLTVVAIERNGVVVERNGQRARVPLP
jgi:general secretion pathway protein B